VSEQSPNTESNLTYEQRIKEKARELVELSKNPPPGLEKYPSDARSIEKYLDDNRFDEVVMYFCDLARYEEGGIISFCEWLAENCPNMLSNNHLMWIMMEEDGVEFEKIREVYLKVDYDISKVEKEFVIDLRKDSEVTMTLAQKMKSLFLTIIISCLLFGATVIGFWAYNVGMVNPSEEAHYVGGNGTMDVPFGQYAVFLKDNGVGCEEMQVNFSKPGVYGGLYDVEEDFSKDCDSIYRNGKGWIFIGELNGSGWLYVDAEWGVSVQDDGTEIALAKDWFITSEDNSTIAFAITAGVICVVVGFVIALLRLEEDES